MEKLKQKEWFSPAGKGAAFGVHGLEYATTRGVNGQLTTDYYGTGKGASQRDEKGEPVTRCWTSNGFNKGLNYLLTPPHGMGDAPAVAQALADKEVIGVFDQLLRSSLDFLSQTLILILIVLGGVG